MQPHTTPVNRATKVQGSNPPGRTVAPATAKHQRGGNPPAPHGYGFSSWIIGSRWFSLLIVHGICFWSGVAMLVNPFEDPAERVAGWLSIVVIIAAYWIINWAWYQANRTWIAIRRRNRRGW